MLRVLLMLSGMLTACSPAPQKAVMTNPRTTPALASAAPGVLPDSPAEALGRRTLSTAFVRLGPAEHLTVELHNGTVLTLRDVTLRQSDYCGLQVSANLIATKFCGGYADVAAARPGGAPTPGQSPQILDGIPIEPARSNTNGV